MEYIFSYHCKLGMSSQLLWQSGLWLLFLSIPLLTAAILAAMTGNHGHCGHYSSHGHKLLFTPPVVSYWTHFFLLVFVSFWAWFTFPEVILGFCLRKSKQTVITSISMNTNSDPFHFLLWTLCGCACPASFQANSSDFLHAHCSSASWITALLGLCSFFVLQLSSNKAWSMFSVLLFPVFSHTLSPYCDLWMMNDLSISVRKSLQFWETSCFLTFIYVQYRYFIHLTLWSGIDKLCISYAFLRF